MPDDSEPKLRPMTDSEVRDYFHRMDTGQIQMGPGQPLLPASYRGSGDFIGLVRAWIVRREDELIAGFQKELDARQWIAWAAAERAFSVEEFTVTPVTLMGKRQVGPLFDDMPPGPTQDGWTS